MLTLGAYPKPFAGHIGVIQANAVHSWTLLRPRPEIILFGDEEGTAETARGLGLRHVPRVAANQFGTPLLSEVFAVIEREAGSGPVCYINSDIVLMQDFMEAVRRVEGLKRFLLVSRRWDLDQETPIDFSDPGWEGSLRESIRSRGVLHSERGIDFFVFPPGLYPGMPPFALGRAAFDNWLVFEARRRRARVVDATEVVTIVHQNHDYSHHPDGKAGVFRGEEARHNLELAGGYFHTFDTLDADRRLTGNGLRRRKPTPAMLRREFSRTEYLRPRLAPLVRLLTRAWQFFKPVFRPLFGRQEWFK
jgi:hypothetical protein